MFVARFGTAIPLSVGLALIAFAACAAEPPPREAPPEPTPALAPLATVATTESDAHEADAHEDDDHEADGHEAGEDPGAEARGLEVFLRVGCSACHGDDAGGTTIAPALPGHTGLQVRRQARGPIGIMPVFGPEKLPADELSDLVAYVEGLEIGENGHGHVRAASPADSSASHHLMALTAFEAGNVAEAAHHIRHIIEIVEGQHLSLMQGALEDTASGDVHDAQHTVERMLADVSPPGETIETLHLKLALSALRVGDGNGATHHLEHVADLEDGEQPAAISEIMGLMGVGDVVEAEERVSDLLGVEHQGVEGSADDEAAQSTDHGDEAGNADDGHQEEAGDEHEEEAGHDDG